MGNSLTREQAFWVLNDLPAIGPVSLNRLLRDFAGDPVAILGASRNELLRTVGIGEKIAQTILDWERHFDLGKETKKAEALGARFISRENTDYPPLLKEIHDPPIGLYCLGNYDGNKASIAIIGSRKTTLYGQGVAREFGRELAARGVCVVSGMARGIDTMAHKGALEIEDGVTVAVLGNGLDIVYPPENIELYKKIQTNGWIVSEFPFGRNADRQTFPMRNRVISGMCQAILVVESDEKGGSLITAKFAGDQGRLVCAIPGRIDQRTSRGCNQLIRDGATLVTSVDELLDELNFATRSPKAEFLEGSSMESVYRTDLSDEDAFVLSCFEGGQAFDVDVLASECGKSVPELSAQLTMLELKGCLAKRLDGRYEAVFSGLRQ